jgi:hypothetical protein
MNQEEFQMSKLISRSRIIGTVAVCLVGVACLGVGYALANQPHMENALASLRSARAELQIATADKGGHRVAAIGDVDAAIAEVRAGIAYAGD